MWDTECDDVHVCQVEISYITTICTCEGGDVTYLHTYVSTYVCTYMCACC